MGLSPKKQEFVDLATARFGNGAVLDMADIREVVKENSISCHGLHFGGFRLHRSHHDPFSLPPLFWS